MTGSPDSDDQQAMNDPVSQFADPRLIHEMARSPAPSSYGPSEYPSPRQGRRRAIRVAAVVIVIAVVLAFVLYLAL